MTMNNKFYNRRERVSNLVFYAQSAITFISGRWERERETERDRERQTDRQTDRDRQRDRDRQTDRQRHRDTDRKTDRRQIVLKGKSMKKIYYTDQWREEHRVTNNENKSLVHLSVTQVTKLRRAANARGKGKYL